MKKSFVLLVCLFALSLTACADKERPIEVNQLPARAQQFLKENFASAKVSYAKEESDWLDKNYEVLFANGDKIEFGKDGEWKEVDCRKSAVPDAVVPQAIRSHVAANHPDLKIVKIDRDKRGYDVKLGNGLELKYDRDYRLTGYDD